MPNREFNILRTSALMFFKKSSPQPLGCKYIVKNVSAMSSKTPEWVKHNFEWMAGVCLQCPMQQLLAPCISHKINYVYKYMYISFIYSICLRLLSSSHSEFVIDLFKQTQHSSSKIHAVRQIISVCLSKVTGNCKMMQVLSPNSQPQSVLTFEFLKIRQEIANEYIRQ